MLMQLEPWVSQLNQRTLTKYIFSSILLFDGLEKEDFFRWIERQGSLVYKEWVQHM